MQTFLPYAGFSKSAQALDYRRLGKQRVEAKQILDNLRGHGSKGWRNHPAVKMWRGYENALAFYGACMTNEWVSRGYKNTLEWTYSFPIIMPGWLCWGDGSLICISHRSNLLRKNREYYSQFGWSEPDNLEYVWPNGLIPDPSE